MNNPSMLPIDYSELADLLEKCLELRQTPIAIRFTEAIPEDMARPASLAPAGCRFWQDAARGGFATDAADHRMCAIGVYTHNLQPSVAQQAGLHQTDLQDALKVFGDLGYVRKEDLVLIPVAYTSPQYVVYCPLADTPLEPDVVLLFVTAREALILSEACQQVEKQNALAMGRPACAVVPQVMNTGRAAMSLGCCGARAYLDVFDDDISVFAIPGGKLPAYADRIEALAEANETLTRFHEIRRREVAAGQTPTVRESLEAL
ncbi:MAG TPA: DUF169 domain-containing protein [Acidobacteriaceae bacterium]|nr:DUF169 domain-containing protein [Acidobacteriaceae bacterium]